MKSSGQHLIRVSHSLLFNYHICDFVHECLCGTLFVEDMNSFCSEKTLVHVKERLIAQTVVGTRIIPETNVADC